MAAPSPNRPSDDDLRRLYEDDGLSSVQIAKRCGVEKITVLRWLRAAGIERRPSGVGLNHRGIEPPTAGELHRMVHVEYLSYRAIAERYGVDHTAIPHWLTKHSIRKPEVWGTRRKGSAVTEPSEQELRDRIGRGESMNSIAQDFDISSGTLRNRCEQYGIETQRDGWNGGHRFTCQDGHLARSTYEQRVDDWLHEHGLDHEVEPAYPWDRRYRADFKVGDTYIEVWGVTHNEAYKRRRYWKVEQCKAYGLPLIEVGSWLFSRGRWQRKLKPLQDAVLGSPAERLL